MIFLQKRNLRKQKINSYLVNQMKQLQMKSQCLLSAELSTNFCPFPPHTGPFQLFLVTQGW